MEKSKFPSDAEIKAYMKLTGLEALPAQKELINRKKLKEQESKQKNHKEV